MTNIYFWGKAISPTFHSAPSKSMTSLVSIHTQEVIRHVQAGAQTTFLVTDQNQLYAIGSNEDGQMGLSFNPHRYIELSKVFVPSKTKIISISCGWYHTLILDQLGCLFSSGKGSEGATGQNTRQNSYGFKQIMTGVRKASAGLDHSLAIKGNKVYGWGNTEDGQLGISCKKRVLAPKQLTVYPCDQIFAGIKYSIFITIKGVYGCGMNGNFQLGLGHDKDIHYPKKLQINDEIVKIWGGNYCFARNKNQEMYVWGTGAFGVFKYPTKIQFFTRCDQLSLGLNFGIVQKNEKIFVWGSNNFGQLGTNSTDIKDYAYECPELTSLDLSVFSCGKNFTMGISYGEQTQIADEEQYRIKTEYAKDTVIEEFYGDQCFEDNQNKAFKQSLYSSFGSNPNRAVNNPNIFNQSVGSGNNNNPFMTSSMKRKKMNLLGQNQANSEKEKSISDATVKRGVMNGVKSLGFSRERSQKQADTNDQIRRLAEEMNELKGLIQEKSKRNQTLDEENMLLKQFIKETMLRETQGKNHKSGSQNLKEQYQSIHALVQRNPYLKSLLGMAGSTNFKGCSTVEQIETFGQKLENLKVILEQVVQNADSDTSSCYQ